MRLDKFLANMGVCSRRDSVRLLRSGAVAVDGENVTAGDRQIDPAVCRVTVSGQPVAYRSDVWLMLNKPEGVVCSTDDPRSETVLDLLDEKMRRASLFPCGRLDKNTLGLVLLTDDGQTAHRLLAPKNHVEKEYVFHCKFPLSEKDIQALENGITVEDGWTARPCRIAMEDPRHGHITLTEGKYHEIKRMLQAVHNQITFLERVRFGPLPLDGALRRGEWRPLTEEEIASLRKAAEKKEAPPR